MAVLSPILLVPAGTPPSITITPPSAVIGESGVASGLFTATLNNGTGPVDITFTTSGAGTFTPATATLTPAAPSVTVTFTPSAAGSNQISVTVTSGRANPPTSPPTYTAFEAATSVWPLRTDLLKTVGSYDMTWLRTSAASVVDFDGVLRQLVTAQLGFNNTRFVRNLIPTTSETFTNNVSWARSNGTAVLGATDPLGGTTAYTLTATSANCTIGNVSGGPIGISGKNYCFSIWARRVSGTGNVELRSGTTTYNNVTAAVTGTWTRIASIATSTNTTAYYSLRLVTSGDVIEIWRGQLEDVSGASVQAPGEYQSVGVLASPFQGAGIDGCRYYETTNGNTLSGGVVTEATGVAISETASNPIGYFVERTITNRILRSEEFDNASWVKTNVTVSANSALAPNGSLHADTLTASANGGTMTQAVTVASDEFCGSIYLKRLTGTGTVEMTIDNGATWTTISVTSTTAWTRFSVPAQTLANPTFGLRFGTNGDAVYAWGAQLEDSNEPTGYTATTSLSVIRTFTQLYPSALSLTDTAGTVYFEVKTYTQSSIGDQEGYTDRLKLTTTGIEADDGPNVVSTTVDLSTKKKVCITWGSGTMRITATGATASSGNYDGSWPAGTTYVGINITDTNPSSVVVTNLRHWYNIKLSATNQDALVGN